MAVRIKKGRALQTLSLTPLIDVVFLLLIFFLVATRFAQEDRELDVELPSATEAKPMIAQPQQVYVNVDKDGQYFVDGKVLTPAEVQQMLQRIVVNNPVNQTVVIRADKRVPLDFVVYVMNACDRVGIFDHPLTTKGD
jgi:biopolymer transport protein ExbD